MHHDFKHISETIAEAEDEYALRVCKQYITDFANKYKDVAGCNELEMQLNIDWTHKRNGLGIRTAEHPAPDMIGIVPLS